MIKSKTLNWTEFKFEIAQNNDSWVYRGQSNSNWLLSTSLERYNFDPEVESKLLNQFKSGFELFVEKEIKYKLDYFAYMQHYGVPTRLLDFTYSPYVAAYFAFEPTQKSEIAIYAVNCKLVNKYYEDYFNSSIVNSLSKSSYFNTIDKLIKGNKDSLYFVNQFHSFDRQFTQKSTFLANCGFRYSTNQLLINCASNSDNKEVIKKYIIKQGERSKALTDLDKMNINGYSLFPGLDGFSRNIKVKNSY